MLLLSQISGSTSDSRQAHFSFESLPLPAQLLGTLAGSQSLNVGFKPRLGINNNVASKERHKGGYLDLDNLQKVLRKQQPNFQKPLSSSSGEWLPSISQSIPSRRRSAHAIPLTSQKLHLQVEKDQRYSVIVFVAWLFPLETKQPIFISRWTLSIPPIWIWTDRETSSEAFLQCLRANTRCWSLLRTFNYRRLYLPRGLPTGSDHIKRRVLCPFLNAIAWWKYDCEAKPSSANRNKQSTKIKTKSLRKWKSAKGSTWD